MAKVQVGVVIEGHKELTEMLNSLENKVQNKFVRHALRVAGKEVLKATIQKVPVDTGALKAGLKLRAMKRKKHRMGVLVMTPTREELADLQHTPMKAERVYSEKGYYPSAVEYGTPKMAARPYMRPALMENAEKIRAIFIADLKEAVASKGKN